ncbi:acetylxylan esterase [Streptomyces sp. NPDC051658]|uniref:acetylxylan esterase n=1 Tax=Streptomyces sp. NPDC051658 TaxID=3365667 RepID=UPI00379E80A7
MSYFDGATLARRGNVSMLFSVGLKDHICPPSTVYAAYNHCGAQRNVDQADKQIRVYPFNDHEGGGPAREVVKSEWPAKRLETSV